LANNVHSYHPILKNEKNKIHPDSWKFCYTWKYSWQTNDRLLYFYLPTAR